MSYFDFDAYSPAEMALRVENAACNKAGLNSASMFTLAMLAGAFIALGAVFYTFVVHDASLGLVISACWVGWYFALA